MYAPDVALALPYLITQVAIFRANWITCLDYNVLPPSRSSVYSFDGGLGGLTGFTLTAGALAGESIAKEEALGTWQTTARYCIVENGHEPRFVCNLRTKP